MNEAIIKVISNTRDFPAMTDRVCSAKKKISGILAVFSPFHLILYNYYHFDASL